MNIGQLRARLNELESKWTAEDDKYMGKFEHQEIYVPVYTLTGEFQGYDKDLVVEWDIKGLGLFIDHEPHK